MVSHLNVLLIKGVKSPQKKNVFLANFARIMKFYKKDQEVIQKGSGGYTTRIIRLYNKDQEVMFSDATIELLQKSFAYKRCQITAKKTQKKHQTFGNRGRAKY